MRLIHCKTLEISEFFGGTPEYAILSHTWGKDEVLFQDMQEHNVQKKHGYSKIQKFCEQATRDGLDYIWIDTCCIDKTSSAELSEAINSMFRWYQNAVICYAYLEDLDSKFKDQEECSSAIAASRWFTRGWTLQELIAPSEVEFYSKDWKFVGQRTYLAKGISLSTGIDESVLLKGARVLERASVARRMSWAAERQTTRAEDMAYCLLGLFDVQMPLLYGEGGPKAFFRLQEEIMKSSMDHSLLAWTPTITVSELRFALSSKFCVERRGWLAMHPEEFRYAGSVDLLPSYQHDNSVTERGIRIRLIILDQGRESRGSEKSWGILRCYEENNLTGPLAIPLIKLEGRDPNIYARDMFAPPIVLTEGHFHIAEKSLLKAAGPLIPKLEEFEIQQNKIKNETTESVNNTPSLYHRYIFSSHSRGKELGSFVQTIFIPKYPKVEDPNHNIFRFVFDPSDYIVVSAFPPDHWNSSGNSLHFRDYDIDEIKGALVLRSVRHKSTLAITVGIQSNFSARDIETGRPSPFLYIQGLSQIELKIDNGYNWWRQTGCRIESTKPRVTSAKFTSEWWESKACIEEKLVMGKPILEVNVAESILTSHKDLRPAAGSFQFHVTSPEQ